MEKTVHHPEILDFELEAVTDNFGLSVSLERSLMFCMFKRNSETGTLYCKDWLWQRKYYVLTKYIFFLSTQGDYIFHKSFCLGVRGMGHMIETWQRYVSRSDVCHFHAWQKTKRNKTKKKPMRLSMFLLLFHRDIRSHFLRIAESQWAEHGSVSDCTKQSHLPTQ